MGEGDRNGEAADEGLAVWGGVAEVEEVEVGLDSVVWDVGEGEDDGYEVEVAVGLGLDEGDAIGVWIGDDFGVWDGAGDGFVG